MDELQQRQSEFKASTTSGKSDQALLEELLQTKSELAKLKQRCSELESQAQASSRETESDHGENAGNMSAGDELQQSQQKVQALEKQVAELLER